jgi:hypothetical protein
MNAIALRVDYAVRRLKSKLTGCNQAVAVALHDCDHCGEYKECGFFGKGWLCPLCVQKITGRLPMNR